MQALEIAQRNNDQMALAYAYQGMAFSLDQGERYAESREYFIRMREQARVAHSRRMEAEAVVGMARVSQPVEGERLMREGIEIYREIGHPYGIAYGTYALASSLEKRGRMAESLAMFNRVVAIYEKYPNKIGMWWALNARSTISQKLGRLDAASADAEHAYRLATEIGFPLYIGESAKRLAAVSDASGNHKRAYDLFLEADELASRVARESSNKRMMELAKRYDVESKKRQFDELNRSNERQAASLRQHELQRRWLYTLIVSSLVVLGVMIFFQIRLRRTNRQLQRSQNDQQAVLDAIPDLLFEVGLDGRYYDCHCVRPELLTAPVNELTGKTVRDVMPEDAAETCLTALREAHETGISTGRQFSLPLPQGESWFELSVARIQVVPGELPRFVVISRNITERRHMLDALTMREREFRTVVEKSPDVIIRFDRECRRTYVNPTYMRLFAESNASHMPVIGATPVETYKINYAVAEEFQDLLKKVMNDVIDGEMQLELDMKDGRMLFLDMRLVPDLDSSGNVCGALAIGRDVTMAKKTEIQLQETSELLRELAARNETVREAERKRIAREIHDELGQMLNAMRFNVLVINYQFGDSNRVLQEHISKLLQNLDRTVNMVRDIVSALHPTVLSAGIMAALDWLTQEFSKSTGIACNLWMEKSVSPDEEQVTAIFRIVQESLNNVLRHSGADLVEISLAVAKNGEAYLLEISDNGSGFDPEQVRKPKSLGLIGMQERAVMLGGTLTISSTEQGTTLQVYIPINREVYNEELT
jgi:PAS domain S-box-containing protein